MADLVGQPETYARRRILEETSSTTMADEGLATDPIAGPRPAIAAHPVRAHGYWEFIWSRLKRDRIALASGGVILFMFLATFVGGPLLERALGHGPNDIFPYAVDDNLTPAGPFSRVPDTNTTVKTGPPEATTLFILGADGTLGRDELLRLLYGGRVSLEVALGATLLAMTIGVLLGSLAALAGGVVDWAISRLTEMVMAFPVLLLLILLGSTVSDRTDHITLGGLLNQGVLSIVLLIGAFTWFYPARIVRAQILSLRTRDFVEAARMTGAGRLRIIRTELLPHLVPSLVVFGSLVMATNIIIEASITFLGVGVRLPTASWGSLLSATWGTLLHPGGAVGYLPAHAQAILTLWPSLAIFATVLSFNLFGEGLRKALEPEGAR
jgi:ABC-type dipeptide/oligopeptide/nickel transport system permease subunit